MVLHRVYMVLARLDRRAARGPRGQPPLPPVSVHSVSKCSVRAKLDVHASRVKLVMPWSRVRQSFEMRDEVDVRFETPPSRSIASALDSLKELITIISGLAATNAVLQLMVTTARGGIYGVDRLRPTSVLLFLVTVVSLFRFYHGNVRHLDEEYSGRIGKAHVYLPKTQGSKRVAADFSVIFTEAMILTSLSFLLRNPRQYVLVFTALLFLDAVWFFLVYNSDEPRSKWWARNNLIFSAIFAVMAIVSFAVPEVVLREAFVVLFASLALINAGFDVLNQFKFYFPDPPPPGNIVFIAAPLTAKLTHQDGKKKTVDPQFRVFLEELAQAVEQSKYAVLLAHQREAWGARLWGPGEAVTRDLQWLRAADVIVALIDDPPSPGVQMELGAALALDKPIIQVYKADVDLPYLNEGFSRPARSVYDVEYSDTSDCIKKVLAVLNTILPTERIERVDTALLEQGFRSREEDR